MKRLAALALFGGTLAFGSGTAQDPKQESKPAPERAAKAPRAVYAVVSGDAPELAKVVGAHFRGEATLIAAPGNTLLVSGAATDGVLRLLEQLDRKPRTVEVEVTIAEVPARDWKDDAKAEDLLRDATGKAAPGQRVRLTAVEGQPVSYNASGSRPFVDGVVRAGPGGGFGGKGGGGPPLMQKSVSYREVGTTLKLTARVGADDAVAVDLSVHASRVRAVDVGDEAAAAAVEMGSLTAKLTVPAGKAVVAQAVRTEGKDGGTVAVVVVAARVVPDGPTRRGK